MMKLYSGTTDPFSHRCRFVLFEKDMDFEIIDADTLNKLDKHPVANPYDKLPMLIERDLVLYEANIINEYVDERFPHPQLMPADPVMRARVRMFLHRIDHDLFIHIHDIEHGALKLASKARQTISDNLLQISAVLGNQKYLLSNEFSMVDVAIAPLLWRLDHYGVNLDKAAAPLMDYAEKLFARPAFSKSMSAAEKAMRKQDG